MVIKAGTSGATETRFSGACRSTGLAGEDSGWSDCTTHFHHRDFRNLVPRLSCQSRAASGGFPMTVEDAISTTFGWESGDGQRDGRARRHVEMGKVVRKAENEWM
jgi:hypothetical protein